MKSYHEIFFPILEREQIKHVVLTGDIVENRKFINAIVMNRMMSEFFDHLHLKLGIEIHIIPGNHDCPFKDSNDMNWAQNLLQQHAKVYDKPTEVEFFKTYKTLLLPWINSSNEEESLKAIKKTKAKYCFAHLELTNFEMDRGRIAEHGMDAKLFSKFSRVFTGHYHHKSDNGTVFYLGVPYEITQVDFNDPKGMHIFDFATNDLTFYQNPVKMFNRVSYNDEGKTLEQVLSLPTSELAGKYIKLVIEKKTNPFYFDKFFDKLQLAGPLNISTVDQTMLMPDSEIDLTNVTVEDTETILKQYVDELEIELDKTTLLKKFKALHMEALSISDEDTITTF